MAMQHQALMRLLPLLHLLSLAFLFLFIGFR
jgi:hypothetical protein